MSKRDNMENNYSKDPRIEETINIMDFSKEVTIGSTVKSAILSKIDDLKVSKTSVFWLNPKLQVAATITLLVLNILTVLYMYRHNSNDTNSISAFATEYKITSDHSEVLN